MLFGIFAGHSNMDLVWPKCVSEFLYNDAILIVYNLLIIKSGFQLTVLEAKPKL